MNQIASVMKTFRITPDQDARWRALIGFRGMFTFTDLVMGGLRLLEMQRKQDLENPARLTDLFTVPAGDQGGAAGGVVVKKQCKRCAQYHVCNEAGYCVRCNLVVTSDGKVTTADQLQAPSPGTSSATSPATSGPGTSSATSPATSGPGTSSATSPATSGPAKKPAGSSAEKQAKKSPTQATKAKATPRPANGSPAKKAAPKAKEAAPKGQKVRK